MKIILFVSILFFGLTQGLKAQHGRGHENRPHYRVVRTVPGGAVVIHHRNYDYHYNNGFYYRPYRNRYRYAIAPRGIRITVLPGGYRTVVWGPSTYYYSTGVFYTLTPDNSYEVIDAPPGVVVADIPDGAQKVTIDGKRYFTINGTYYKKVSNGYEVVGTDKNAIDKDQGE